MQGQVNKTPLLVGKYEYSLSGNSIMFEFLESWQIRGWATKKPNAASV